MKPLICNYYLTYRCNARCSFCNIWNDRSILSGSESSVNIVCRNLDDAHKLGAKFVDFTGGEPLLYNGLREVLIHAKKIGLKTTLTSNGLIYPPKAGELSGLIDILQFSIAGADDDSNDTARGVKSFQTIIESIDAARYYGDVPTLIHTVTDDNLPRVPGVIEFARRMDVPLFLNPCFTYPGNTGMSAENVSKLHNLSKGDLITADRGYIEFVRDGGNRAAKPRCLAVDSTIVISPDDCLILPCFHYRKKSLPIEGKLLELYRSPEVIKERSIQGRYTFCEGCTVYCYMRASLIRRPDKYGLLSVFSGLKYFHILYKAGRKVKQGQYKNRERSVV
jgi:MoaA/NifB/PqqE/SkfB family radical SAM enzyme